MLLLLDAPKHYVRVFKFCCKLFPDNISCLIILYKFINKF